MASKDAKYAVYLSKSGRSGRISTASSSGLVRCLGRSFAALKDSSIASICCSLRHGNSHNALSIKIFENIRLNITRGITIKVDHITYSAIHIYQGFLNRKFALSNGYRGGKWIRTYPSLPVSTSIRRPSRCSLKSLACFSVIACQYNSDTQKISFKQKYLVYGSQLS